MSAVTTTRSGRIVKKPVIYEPAESDLVDDYKDDEYESGDDEGDTDSIVTDEDSSSDDDTSSLDSFLVDEDEDCD